MKFKLTKNQSGQVTEVEQVKDLQFWKENAEEDYLQTPISVLKYISKLETELEAVCGRQDMKIAFRVGYSIGYGKNTFCYKEVDKIFTKWFKQFKKK